MNNITDIYWNVIQELLKKLNYYEENYACHITHVSPSGNIEYEFNPICTNLFLTVNDEEDE
jgi:hypothetical protein